MRMMPKLAGGSHPWVKKMPKKLTGNENTVQTNDQKVK